MNNFNNYVINPTDGTVWSKKSGRIIGRKHPKGYVYVTLFDDEGKRCNYMLHRLIWECVNGEILEHCHIHHKDHNPSNNRIENLQLVDSHTHLREHKKGENNPNYGKHLSEETKRKLSEALKGHNLSEKHYNSRVCAKLDKNTCEILEVLPCVTDFQRKYGYLQGHISECCRGKRKTAYSYRWKFIN